MGWTVALQQYGEKWRRDRTYFHQFFNQTAVENYHEVQMKYTKVLLKRFYQSPDDYRSHLRCSLGGSILEVTYGIEAISEKDTLLVLSENTVQRCAEAGIPGTYLVDIFPILKYIPSWFPGAKFRRELNQLGKQVLEMRNKPLEIAKTSLKNGDARSSVVSALIENFENNPDRPDDYEEIIEQVTGVAYIAAIDTTNGVLLHFVYTMLLHPEVQRRVQEELDKVVITSKPDADKFNPERFLDERMPAPDFAFGYGRRECPGRYFADNGLFIIMVSILHVFNILPFEGENGPELPPKNHFDSGIILQPKPFKFRIIPRSPDAIRILEELDY
ncbi:hypothetical protein Clacol_005265 [Clathrus columnatus]|uniref:Cytochrome P450 n=1 Tax=Clathrus columnatus TaxID=1419009 RepID=A0AAV5AE92_9AGAM|nr:hypothetical protein Clacol_005265 [Clathrus columnatus]